MNSSPVDQYRAAGWGFPRFVAKEFRRSRNFTLGIKETLCSRKRLRQDDRCLGHDITVCTSAKTDERSARVADCIQLPFRQ